MKKLILSSAIMLALFSMAFANRPDNITDRAAASFQKDFYKTSEVKSEVINDHVRVTFSQDNVTKYAYYNFQGELIGVVQHILTSSLPKDLQEDIKKHYAKYWVTELFQVTTEEGVYYYLRLTNADENVVLSTEDTNGWHRYMTKKLNSL
jgi:hypothetical protein